MPHTRVLSLCLALVAALCLSNGSLAFAQQAPPPAPSPDPIPTSSPTPSEIELNTIDLPTTMSLGRHKSYFRLTHRFARDLRRGDFSGLAADLFSLDTGAIIGLEYRFAITGNLHAGIHRSLLSKTIQTFAKLDVLRQGESFPVAVSVMGSYEGLNNLREHHQPGVAVTVSRTIGNVVALYATPAFVNGTQAVDIVEGHEDHGIELGGNDSHSDEDHTWFTGFGARLRFSRSGYIVGEYTPRISGYDPNADTWGLAIEKRTAGHTLQVNFTNTFATTLGQLSRGGNKGQVLLGFNITRRF
jgi:hypothetical protein